MNAYLEYRENRDEGKYDEGTVRTRLDKKNRTTGGGGGGGKRRYFPSNVPQTFIANAATGVVYPYKVGSTEQNLLYKIVDATGTCDANGFVIRTNKGSRNDEEADEKEQSVLPNPNTNHLFFDSPEQCMSHMRLVISKTDVARWHEGHRLTV